MHIDVLPLFIFSCLFYLGRSICVPVYIDGVYPLYAEQACALYSSPINSTTVYKCDRHTCNSDTWTAPCSNGLFVTRHECETGVCEKTWRQTCQSDKSISNYNYGGTCTVVAQSGQNGGTPATCQNAGGTWSWAMTAEACQSFAVQHNYVTFAYNLNSFSHRCLVNSIVSMHTFVGFTACEATFSGNCTDCSTHNKDTCPYYWNDDGYVWDKDAATHDYHLPNGAYRTPYCMVRRL